MNASETIKSWRWRLKRIRHKSKDFAPLIGIDQSLFSAYCSGRISPSIERFDLIENKIKELELNAGV